MWQGRIGVETERDHARALRASVTRDDEQLAAEPRRDAPKRRGQLVPGFGIGLRFWLELRFWLGLGLRLRAALRGVLARASVCSVRGCPYPPAAFAALGSTNAMSIGNDVAAYAANEVGESSPTAGSAVRMAHSASESPPS